VAAGRSTGADGEAVQMPPPRRRPSRRARLHRARRLGAGALLLLLVVLCIGPVRSYMHAGTATQRLRADVAQLDREHAKLQVEYRSASRTPAMIAQARAQGYIRPGEKPFALTP
jgi:type VI protein secretion system component VasK